MKATGLSCNCGNCGSTPTPGVTNRPGLSALSYRIGTYGSFFEAMKARLSSGDFSFPPATPPLRALKTRDQSDAAIAMLDAWAILADVLTFYQERIANEGYLRTATERQSIVYLSALLGAVLRPGVAASTYLAYTIDPNSDSIIPAGSSVQSVPGPGQLPQTFETSEDASGSGEFTNLAPRLTRPQQLSAASPVIYAQGLTNNLNPNDVLLLVSSPGIPVRIASVDLDVTNNWTVATLQASSNSSGSAEPAFKALAAPAQSTAPAPPTGLTGTVVTTPTPAPPAQQSQTGLIAVSAIESFIPALSAAPAKHPATALDLTRRTADVYQADLDTAPKLVRALHPEAADDIYPALANATVTPPATAQVFAFRVKAPVFGHNAPLKPILSSSGIVIGTEDWPLAGGVSILISIGGGTNLQGNSPVVPTETYMREGMEAFISVTQGNASSSGSVKIPYNSTDKTQTVGGWEVDVTGGLNGKQPQITIGLPKFGRVYNITFETLGLIKVVTDGPSVTVVSGQSATADENGRHLLVSAKSGFVLNDDAPQPPDQLNVISLDAVYDKIVPGGYIYVERADTPSASVVAQVQSAVQVSLNTYGVSARVTQLTLNQSWLNPATDLMLSVARNTTVYAQSDQLQLADEPITDPIAGDTIELGDLYSDLQPGRWLIVSGERADIVNTTGITASELVMLASVKQGVQQIPAPSQTPAAPSNTPVAVERAAASTVDSTNSASTSSASASGNGASDDSGSAPVAPSPMQPLPGDTTHSFLQLASPLAYSYTRETVTISGNVVPATNGATKKEVIGSGDSSQTFQQFKLQGSPLTYVSAATPSGAASTLAVYVNGIKWQEIDSLTTASPTDRVFVTSVDSQNNVTVTFGDGQHGMRLPTGMENIQAIYRTGIGSGGNLDPGTLTLLTNRPLGVRSVTNPVAATGGANADSANTGRRNAPLASIALDRLVSVTDYASFARTFAGIGKATSAMLSDGHQQVVVVSVTGAEGAVLDADSQVVQQLEEALLDLGDPHFPVTVLTSNALLLVISARISILADYLWTDVAPLIRTSLLKAFCFDSQQPGATVYLSMVTAAIQKVPGVQYCVIDAFSTISRGEVDTASGLSAKFSELAAQSVVPGSIPVAFEHADATGQFQPSEIAYVDPAVPDTILLTEITS
jgi:predicted phage baseplate assembly protein